jgi:hypothetical protein
MIVTFYWDTAAFLQKRQGYWEQNGALRGDFNDYLTMTAEPA